MNQAEHSLTPKDFVNIRQAIYHERRKHEPTLPCSREDVLDLVRQGTISTPDNMIFAVDDAIVLITFKEKFTIICNDKEFFRDGTFKHCPVFFYQMYVIHTECNGHFIPFFHCILPGKSALMYEKMLKMICDECKKNEVDFNPKPVHLDFEAATHQAFKTVFPNVKIKT